MAYGMRPQELAAVGRNVSSQGQGVSEESIQTAMDAELDEDRKATIARNKKRAAASRVKTAENKAAMRSALISSAADVAVKSATAVAETRGGGDGPRSEQVSARAERAGERGNVVKQARLQDRAAGLRGKEDIRLAAQQTKLNQRAARRQPRVDARAARLQPKVDARAAAQQRKLDEYKLKQEYGGDTKLRSYRKPGSLYGKPSAVRYSLGEQEGDIMSSAGGSGSRYAGILSTKKP